MKYYFLTLLSVCYGLANGQTVKTFRTLHKPEKKY